VKYELDYDELLDAVDDANIDGDALRVDYSGRAMYGSSCVAIVGKDSDLVRFTRAVVVSEMDDDWLDEVRADGMGRDTVYYWPSVQVAGVTA
jgi:hypothetical protein